MKNRPSLHSVINQKLIKESHDCDLYGIFTFINPFSYLQIRKKPVELTTFDKLGFDGILMCIIWKLLYGVNVKRTSFDFTSFAKIIFNSLNNTGKSLYVIGSKQTEIELFIEKISHEYPQLNIIGYRNGYFASDKERLESINKIIFLKPDFVIAGMGTFFQEQFLIDLKKAGWSGSGFTCGGFIHQTAKAGVHYYPRSLNKLNLRWLFRIFDEPKLFKRYAFQYPVALVLIFFDYLELKI